MAVTPKNDEIKTYELDYLLTPLVAPEQVVEAVEMEVKRHLATASATIKKEWSAELRPLAYAVKKVVEHKSSTFREAYFGGFVFTAAPEAMPALEAALKKSDRLIRHLLIILPARALLAPAKPRQIPGAAPAPVTPGVPEPKMTTAAIDKEIDNLIQVA